MVTTDATTSTTSSSSAAAAMKKSTGLNKDDFLQLFIKQLQNQDPLNPQDSSQFITQLAQLTQVEQSYNTNDNLAKLLSALESSQSTAAVSYLGKNIDAVGSSTNYLAGSTPTIGFRLPQAASRVEISLADSTGAVVRTIKLGSTAAGDKAITWDGQDGTGKQVPAGTYNWSVKGYNADGSSFDGTSLISGSVNAVKYDNGSAILTVGGIDVALSDVVRVKGGSTQ